MDPARVALAFVARRQGVSQMPASAWAHVLSLELGWLPPGEAKAFVAACAEAGLLSGEPARIGFDAKSVEVPRGFRLSVGVRPEPATQDPFLDALQAIAARSGKDQGEVLSGMSATQDTHGGLLDATAALLLWASQEGMDVRSQAQDALAFMQADG